VLLDQRPQLVDQLVTGAELELRLESRLEHEQPELFEPLGIESQRAVVAQARERRARLSPLGGPVARTCGLRPGRVEPRSCSPMRFS
jgi:hypothetical protein